MVDVLLLQGLSCPFWTLSVAISWEYGGWSFFFLSFPSRRLKDLNILQRMGVKKSWKAFQNCNGGAEGKGERKQEIQRFCKLDIYLQAPAA